MEALYIAIMVLAGGALAIPALAPIRKREGEGVPIAIALAVLLISMPILLLGLMEGKGASSPAIFRIDAMGYFFGLVVVTVSILATLSSIDYMKGEPNPSSYYSLILFTALGMVLLSFSANLLMIIVAWELMGLSTCVLACFRKKDPACNEAAVKYFMIAAFSSAILLYAMSIVFGITGSLDLYEIVARLATAEVALQPLAVLAVVLFIAGIGFKISAVPFHMWVPDVYEGAPTTVSVLLSSATKKAGFAVAIRIFVVALPLVKVDWSTAFAILALLTMTLGNVAALTQRNITRMLAYSSIAQAGYMLIGLAVAPYTAITGLAIIGLLYHVLNHAIMKSSAFVAAAGVSHGTHRVDLENYDGLGFRMPITSFSLAVSLLALAGIPPLNGFWSKLVLFAAAIEGGKVVWWGPWLAIAGVINSAFSLGYYAWVIKRMYMDEGPRGERVPEPRAMSLTLLISTVAIVVTGVYPWPIYDLIRSAAFSVVS